VNVVSATNNSDSTFCSISNVQLSSETDFNAHKGEKRNFGAVFFTKLDFSENVCPMVNGTSNLFKHFVEKHPGHGSRSKLQQKILGLNNK
jgi:hypothetical protein